MCARSDQARGVLLRRRLRLDPLRLLCQKKCRRRPRLVHRLGRAVALRQAVLLLLPPVHRAVLPHTVRLHLQPDLDVAGGHYQLRL